MWSNITAWVADENTLILASEATAFLEVPQEQDSPRSAGHRQAPDQGSENVSLHSAQYQWSFLAVDNYVFFVFFFLFI